MMLGRCRVDHYKNYGAVSINAGSYFAAFLCGIPLFWGQGGPCVLETPLQGSNIRICSRGVG